MTTLVRRFRRFFVAAQSYIPFCFEIGLTLASARAAVILLTNPNLFIEQPLVYAWLTDSISDNALAWGLLALAASLLKAVGMLCLFTRSERKMEAAFILREIGWGISFVFWTCIGTALMAANPLGLGAGATLLLGMFALGIMVAGPVMPDDVHDRQ